MSTRAPQADSQRSFMESMDSGFSSSQGSFQTCSQLHATSIHGDSQEKSQSSMQRLYKMYTGKVPGESESGENFCGAPSSLGDGLAREILEKVAQLCEIITKHLSEQQDFVTRQRELFDEAEKKIIARIDRFSEEVLVSQNLLLKKIEQLERKIYINKQQMANLKQDIHLSKCQDLDLIFSNLRDPILADTQLILQTLHKAHCTSTTKMCTIESVLTQSFSSLKNYVGKEIHLCRRPLSPLSPPKHRGWDLPRGGSSENSNSMVEKSLLLSPMRSKQTSKNNADACAFESSGSTPRFLAPTITDCRMSVFNDCKRVRLRHTPTKLHSVDVIRQKRLVLRNISSGNLRGRRILMTPSSRATRSMSLANSMDLEMKSWSSSSSSPTLPMNMLSLNF